MRETNRWSKAVITVEAGRRHCFLEHLLRLDAETRLQRFCHRADDACLGAYVADLDFAAGRIIGCFAAGAMRGAAELRPAGAPCSGVFEATFSVEKDWQGRGIGTALILRAIPVARQIGARCILVDCLAGSEPMRRIVGRFDAELLFDHDDCMAWLPLSATSRRDRGALPPPAIRRSVLRPG